MSTTKTTDNSLYAEFNKIKVIPLSVSSPVVYQSSKDNKYYLHAGENREALSAAYNGRSLTEANLTKLLSSLVDRHSFVIDGKTETTEDTTYYYALSFVLDGYYFELEDSTLLSSTTSDLYAKLDIEDSSSEWFSHLNGYSTLTDGSSVAPTFQGIIFKTTATSGYTPLLIDGKIPLEYQYRLESRSIANIDGGTI